MQDEALHRSAAVPEEEDTVHDCNAANPACHQQSQDASLPLCPPLTQLSQRREGSFLNAQTASMMSLSHRGECSSPHAQTASMLSSENQMLQLPLVVHRAEVNTGFSDSLECDAPDAAEPVSQVLPDTAMELWDFGGDEQPEPKYAVAGAGDDSRAAEALEELEDFCRCELLASASQASTARSGDV